MLYFPRVGATSSADLTDLLDSSPYNGYGTLGTRVYTPGYYNFTMFANPPVNGTSLFQFNIRPNAGKSSTPKIAVTSSVGETNKFLASDFVMTEFQDVSESWILDDWFRSTIFIHSITPAGLLSPSQVLECPMLKEI